MSVTLTPKQVSDALQANGPRTASETRKLLGLTYESFLDLLEILKETAR